MSHLFMARCCLLVLALIWASLGAWAADGATSLGSPACIACHPDQGRQWQASHHRQSMQVASPATVLGDFNDARFDHHGQVSRFFRRDGHYWVNTEGPDGRRADFEIGHTFGVYPLQQYLIALPGGRRQAFGVAWDARPKAQGGQHWFALYPEKISPGDSLHWSGREQNWNFQCAACHSTGVRKNFDLAQNRFDTQWDEINVGCEACHGPGSRHQSWAQAGAKGKDAGLLRLDALRSVSWAFGQPQQNIASPQGPLTRAKQEEQVCYGCHARRQELTGGHQPGVAFLDQYLPDLLEPGLYHADGQIDGEVFEYGSFVQSRMHGAGVGCGNCHQAHSLKLKAEGNALCGQCHNSRFYDQASHHHHDTDSAGSRCISCHMPSKTYMGVHERHDHGFKVPRPDLSAVSGAPNACGQCHQDTEKNAAWAAAAIAQWTGKQADASSHFAPGLAAARSGDKDNAHLAPGLAAEQPAMVRATALNRLAGTLNQLRLNAIQQAMADPDGLVRMGAARALAKLPPASAPLTAALGARLLIDPLRAVRVEAARSLAPLPAAIWSAEQRPWLAGALDELIQAELTAADRPEAHVNLSRIYGAVGRLGAAEQSLITALRLAPDFLPALVNLADFYRANGRDGQGEALLQKAVTLAPAAAAPAHALGLLRIRQGRLADALPWLAKAVALDAGNSRHAQVYALALAESGAVEQALTVLTQARLRLPRDPSLLQSQINLERRLARLDAASRHELELRRLAP